MLKQFLETVSVACPNCASKLHENVYADERTIGGRQIFKIRVGQCGDCGFVYNTELLTSDSMELMYAISKNASGQVFRDEGTAGYYPKLHAERSAFLKSAISSRESLSLLDVGCGSGGFLKSLRDANSEWDIRGLDPSERAIENCLSQGLSVIQGTMTDLREQDECFDVISLVSVLEHIAKPSALVSECFQKLKPEGVLFIEVPNTLEPEVSLTGFFNAEHIVHFTPYSLSRMLHEVGFQNVVIDETVSHVVRLVASCEAALLTKERPILEIEDDRETCRKALQEYVKQEQELIGTMRVRVRELLLKWHEEGRSIAVYGAGLHTEQLSEHIDFSELVDVYLDGDPIKQGELFLGKKVVAPSQLGDAGIDAVLISSGRFAGEMTDQLRRLEQPDLVIGYCYE